MVKYLNKIKRFKKHEKPTKQFKKRIAGAALSYLFIALLFGLFVFVFMLRMASDTSGSWTDALIGYVMTTLNGFEELVAKVEVKLLEWGAADIFFKYVSFFVTALGDLLTSAANKTVSSVTAAGNGLLNFFLGVVIGFYFIMDKNTIKNHVIEGMDLFIPKKANVGVKRFFSRVHQILSGYIQGMLADVCIVAVLISGWLAFVGVDFAVVIGIIAGLANIVPFVGAFAGFVLAILASLISGDPMKALYAGIGIFAIQQIDGMFIQPKVVGVNVKISPVLVLVSLAIAGKLFGLVGMVLAVPVCAVIKMLLEDIVNRRRQMQ